MNKMITSSVTPYVRLSIKNGFYIPIISYLIYKTTDNLFLSTIIGLKLFPANYFYWFCYNFDYFPEPYKKYNQLKQFVRLTDTGHMVSFIYYFYPRFFPIAFNIHFIITIGYWYSIIVLNLSDTSETNDVEYIVWFNKLWAYAVHIIPLLLFFREMYLQEQCYHYFTNIDLYYSYLWTYMWLFCIYCPWRYYTKDVVYSILDNNEPFKNKCKIFVIMNMLIIVSNYCGYYVSNICKVK